MRYEPDLNRLPGPLSWYAGILSVSLWFSLVSGTAQGGGFRSPEECQGSTGEDHVACLYSYIGIPQEDTGNDQATIHTENEMLEQLREQREQVDRRALGGQEQQPQRQVDRMKSNSRSFRSPEECRAYTGNAHLNCLYAYIEMQESKTGKVEDELRAQREMLGQLRDQVDRQAFAGNALERKFAERDAPPPSPAPAYAPPFYPGYAYPGYGYLGYSYPLPGLSLYFGVPGSYYGRPFYGPRFYGPRFFGPRFYGPRFFGRRRW